MKEVLVTKIFMMIIKFTKITKIFDLGNLEQYSSVNNQILECKFTNLVSSFLKIA